MTAPPRLLLSDSARTRLGERLAAQAVPVSLEEAERGAPFDAAFVSRDVTGLSTKHEVQPGTARFYDAMRAQAALRWVHVHSAGADRPVYVELRARGVQVTTSAGTNAAVVAQTALAGVLALARRFPELLAAQRERRWASLMGTGLPRDLAGQTAVVVGWGAIGQQIGAWLGMLGLHVVAVRRERAQTEGCAECVAYGDLPAVLPRADWLVLACPLTERTRGLVDAAALAHLPAGAHLINVARGEVVDEPALIAALRTGRLAGAYLDVFAHEPLPPDSPLWRLPGVIATPHSAGFSDGNAARVEALFLDNLARWRAGQPLRNPALA
ncbi:D-2-hydroxyacid dehydrogenase [Acidovorax sp. MR-S7]|uniref:D-2-hydroxyacid dehydrogenase n=1 Tax=Acidovorax sp. MR-S7 TaxID=1268622 RepID=UPI000379F646|nr:D-2-hydroxyacid dehydrogenase [Acidovorax sp. MR-S7]GAD22294.1 phosphoglycerate dehydrogenase and related dehydrogenases [Acidovorax sp. MR-S7]